MRGIGVLSSIVGTYLVRGSRRAGGSDNALTSINRGFYSSAAISLVAFFVLAMFYMHEWRAFLSVGVGIILAIALDELTKYFTDTHHKPVKDIAGSNQDGSRHGHPARPRGRASRPPSGRPSSSALTILAAVLIYWGQDVAYVLYGVAMTGIGMLTLTGNNVAMDSFGPISDNANGIGEMAGLDQKARQIMADLDAVGNTTKAITKGVAIGSAVIAAVSLFGSFLTDVSLVQKALGFAKETWLHGNRDPDLGAQRLHRHAHRRHHPLALLLPHRQLGGARRGTHR